MTIILRRSFLAPGAVLGVCALFIVAAFLREFVSPEVGYTSRINEAKAVFAFVQEHQAQTGMYPEIVPAEVRGDFSYQRLTSSRFVLSFESNMGAPVVYDSDTGRWD